MILPNKFELHMAAGVALSGLLLWAVPTHVTALGFGFSAGVALAGIHWRRAWLASMERMREGWIGSVREIADAWREEKKKAGRGPAGGLHYHSDGENIIMPHEHGNPAWTGREMADALESALANGTALDKAEAMARRMAHELAGKPPHEQAAALAIVVGKLFAGYHPGVREDVIKGWIGTTRALAEEDGKLLWRGRI